MSARPRLADLAELVRFPAALTVPGDTLAGAAAAGRVGPRSAALPLASICFYWAGMALNDYADRDLDATERPERPLPSGRVRPGHALAAAVGLSVSGMGIAALTGGRSAARTAGALAGVVWAYDLVLKEGPLGPAAMAAARGLDVLLGASAAGRTSAGTGPAALLALHTAGVTLLSRGEVHGAAATTARVATGATVVTALGTALRGRALLPCALAVTYAATVGRAQAAAVATPDAGTVRRATGVGIHGMIPLQAALAADRSPAAAWGILAVGPIARAASRVVSPT